MEKKVTFLFGSGADTDACKKLKSGATFAADIISNKYNSIIESLLGEKLGNFKLIYPSSKYWDYSIKWGKVYRTFWRRTSG